MLLVRADGEDKAEATLFDDRVHGARTRIALNLSRYFGQEVTISNDGVEVN